MAFVQLFKLESNNGKFVDWESGFRRPLKRRPAVPLATPHRHSQVYGLEKGVRNIDVGDGKQYEVRSTIVSIDYDYPG